MDDITGTYFEWLPNEILVMIFNWKECPRCKKVERDPSWRLTCWPCWHNLSKEEYDMYLDSRLRDFLKAVGSTCSSEEQTRGLTP